MDGETASYSAFAAGLVSVTCPNTAVDEHTWFPKNCPEALDAQGQRATQGCLQAVVELVGNRDSKTRSPLKLLLGAARGHDHFVQLMIDFENQLPREWSRVALEAYITLDRCSRRVGMAIGDVFSPRPLSASSILTVFKLMQARTM